MTSTTTSAASAAREIAAEAERFLLPIEVVETPKGVFLKTYGPNPPAPRKRGRVYRPGTGGTGSGWLFAFVDEDGALHGWAARIIENQIARARRCLAETIREYRRSRDRTDHEGFRAWANRQARNARDGKPHGGNET